MRIHNDWKALPAEFRGASVAMGNFDGVHLGHRLVIDTARAAADVPLGVILFEPHPREFFAPDAPPFRLMNAQSRANRLARLGVEHLYQLPFGAVLAGLSPETFAREVLVEGLAIRHISVGENFHFGQNRSGNAATLQALGREMGFGVSVAELLGDEASYSSSAIRRALSAGEMREAARMLGHWHRIEGEVVHGAKRGRDFGYPTANLALDQRLHLPAFGIYAVLVDVLTGPFRGNYSGVVNLGIRPSFGENQPNLEVHIFDFQGLLYGEQLSIALVEYMRPEIRYDNTDRLIAQIGRDCVRARDILAGR